MTEADAAVHEPWPSAPREDVGLQFAMWVFLATEVLFFGALFFFYAVNRWAHPQEVSGASHHAAFWYGVSNTVILTLSGFCMAVADRALKASLARLATAFLWATFALGAAFLLVKGLEYHKDLDDSLWPGPGFALTGAGARPFWSFYWISTLLHAIHLTIGLGVIGRLLLIAARGRLESHPISMTVSTLYWEFVDMVWLFLFALIYLAGHP
ncbi:MAG TPA: cytochrome c oxidase subunit 3 [Caulobacteraceae bacterium]|nr:cytochrome c oxidase subunit 3 [Caulobacteraceae bacterium]